MQQIVCFLNLTLETRRWKGPEVREGSQQEHLCNICRLPKCWSDPPTTAAEEEPASHREALPIGSLQNPG